MTTPANELSLLGEPFEDFNRRLTRYSPHFRCEVEARADTTAGDWRLLALRCRDRIEDELWDGSVLDYSFLDRSPRRRTTHTPHHGTATRNSTASGRVRFPDDDPLKVIPAAQYLPVLTGEVVSESGWTRCPMPDHPDEHPSAKAYGPRWVCFACGAKGTIIDAAAAVYGLESRGADYFRLRDRILHALLYAPVGQERL